MVSTRKCTLHWPGTLLEPRGGLRVLFERSEGSSVKSTREVLLAHGAFYGRKVHCVYRSLWWTVLVTGAHGATWTRVPLELQTVHFNGTRDGYTTEPGRVLATWIDGVYSSGLWRVPVEPNLRAGEDYARRVPFMCQCWHSSR